MRVNHNLGILETLTLGHAYMGAGLMTSMIKGNDKISIAIKCGGLINRLSVETATVGKVRDYLFANPIPVTTVLQIMNFKGRTAGYFFKLRLSEITLQAKSHRKTVKRKKSR